MAVKFFVIFVTVFAFIELSSALPTRRQYGAITEASASDNPVTNDGTAWEDDDEFDLDGDDGWFSQAVVSPSSAPENNKGFNEYDDDYSQGNVMVEFGDDDDDDEEDDGDENDDEEQEDDGSRNDSEFLFVPPKDTRLVLEDDDDEQSGPIKVRHTGRSSYPHVSEGIDNSLESSEEDKNDNEQRQQHSYEFTIDEEDKEGDDADNDEDDNPPKDDDGDSIEVLPQRELRDDDNDEDDDFVSEGDNNRVGDGFDDPDEEAAQVIYGDHVFLY